MLSTKNAPNEITSFEDFTERALNFDFYTHFSDDHGVYLAGERRRKMMDAYAAENPVADKLWKFVCKETSEAFFAGQLIRRVASAVFDDDLDKLKDFTINYLADSGRDSRQGKSIRDAIADEIGATLAWDEKQAADREAMIDTFIATHKQKSQEN